MGPLGSPLFSWETAQEESPSGSTIRCGVDVLLEFSTEVFSRRPREEVEVLADARTARLRLRYFSAKRSTVTGLRPVRVRASRTSANWSCGPMNDDEHGGGYQPR
jgi:hypothetical protein